MQDKGENPLVLESSSVFIKCAPQRGKTVLSICATHKDASLMKG